MSATTSQKPSELQQPNQVVNKYVSESSNLPKNVAIDFIEMFRSEAKNHRDMDLSDPEIIQVIIEHWDDIMQGLEKDEFPQADIDQMRKFVLEKAAQLDVIKPSHKSIDRWLEMLDGLLYACRAFVRIEQFLLSRSTSRPEYAQAPTLFPTLSKLPKVPRPDWVAPAVSDPGIIYIQMQHSFVYTSKGVVLYPEDVAQVLLKDMKLLPEIYKKAGLSVKHKERLKRITTNFRELRAEKTSWKQLRIQQKTEKKSSAGSSATATPSSPSPFMTILETYHFVSRLADFYEPHFGPEFDHARSLLLGLRRELQKDLTGSLQDLDFTKYLS